MGPALSFTFRLVREAFTAKATASGVDGLSVPVSLARHVFYRGTVMDKSDTSVR